MSNFIDNFSDDEYDNTKKRKGRNNKFKDYKINNIPNFFGDNSDTIKNKVLNNNDLTLESSNFDNTVIKKKFIKNSNNNCKINDNHQNCKHSKLVKLNKYTIKMTKTVAIYDSSLNVVTFNSELYNGNKEGRVIDIITSPSDCCLTNTNILVKNNSIINKKKRHNKGNRILGLNIIFIQVMIIIMLTSRNVAIPQFIGKDISYVKMWAISNNISVDINGEYSLEYDYNTTIAQVNSFDNKVMKGSKIGVTVSLGPDPDEIIVLPDFSEITYNEVNLFLKENKLINAKLIQKYDEKVLDGNFIELEFSSKNYSAKNYTRKNQLNIIYSKGVKPILKDIKVPKFISESRLEVENWANKHKVILSFSESFSDKIEKGFILEQSIKEGQMISIKDVVELTVSKGNPLIVPNYYNYSKEDGQTISNIIKLNIKCIYSTSIGFGQLISQSKQPGFIIYDNDYVIDLVYSEGLPFIDDLTGKNKRQLEGYFTNLNSKGANLFYVFSYSEDRSVSPNTVVNVSVKNDYVKLGDTITIWLSK